MACPYLASYSNKTATPAKPADENVCYGAGTQYWDYVPVAPMIQDRLCLKTRFHSCQRFQKANQEDHSYPDGAKPSQSPRGAAAKPWWKLWG